MNAEQILLAICCFVTGHCLFLAAALWRFSHKISNRLLSAWLLLIAIRTGKSVFGMLYEPAGYAVNVIGVIAMAFIGPVVLWYLRSLHQASFRLTRIDIFHLIPVAALLISVPFLNWKWLGAEYYLATTIVMIYMFYIFYDVYTNRSEYEADGLKWRWTMLFLSGATVLAISFALQIIFYNRVIYFINVIVASVVAYGLSWWAFGSSRIFTGDAKKRTSADPKLEELASRVRELIGKEEVYTDPLLTLTKLAHQLKAPAYLVSQAINIHFDKTFPELLLQQRIHKAESMLLATLDNLTIEAIAYECGFNTLSAFYSAFKKIHQQTPTQYKNAKVKSKLRVA